MKIQLPFVSIVMANYNGIQHLKDCMESFENLDYPKDKLEVIMVDNCSTDESISFIQKNFPETIILKNDVNNYVRANNLGIKSAKGEFVAFINNDVQLDKRWLGELANAMLANTRAGIVGGKILFKDHRIQSTGHEELPDYYWGDRGFQFDDKGQFENIEEVVSLCGAACLVRKKCFDEVGLFDEDFIMYLEDVDMCLRCAKKGWKILYIPSAIAHHYFRGTSNAGLVRYFSERNRLFVLAKHFPDKLADMLYGKGYFSESVQEAKRNDIYDIFPNIITKLFASHDRQYIDRLLADIFKSLRRIVNLEKSSLVGSCEELLNAKAQLNSQIEQLTQTLNAKDSLLAKQESSLHDAASEIAAKNTELAQLNSQIKQLSQGLTAKDAFISEKEVFIAQLNSQIEQLTQTLNAKDSLLAKQESSLHDAASEIAAKNTELQNIKYELALVKSDFERIIKVEKPVSILIIKPYHVCVEDTESVIKALRQKYPNADINLLANLFTREYERLSKNACINKIYRPQGNNPSLIAVMKIILELLFKWFDVVLILASRNRVLSRNGHRKARLMTSLIFANTQYTYYID